jgi:hypothetical protein
MHKLSVIFPVLLTGALSCAQAQWLSYPDARTPHTKDGKPNLTAPAPRLNGKPDLAGLWEIDQTPYSELKGVVPDEILEQQVDLPTAHSKYLINLFSDIKPEDDPSRAEALALMKQRQETSQDLPESRCLPNSVPVTLTVLPFKIIQTPQQIVELFEHYDPPRQVYTDGRPLPKDPNPSWMGYASGKWAGDTLVIESAGYNDRTWLDASGHPRSEQLRMIERYRRRDFGHMDIEITINDPTYYTRSFTVNLSFHLIPDSDVLEAVCAENERDHAHTAKTAQ